MTTTHELEPPRSCASTLTITGRKESLAMGSAKSWLNWRYAFELTAEVRMLPIIGLLASRFWYAPIIPAILDVLRIRRAKKKRVPVGVN